VSTDFGLGIQKEPIEAGQTFFVGRARTCFTSRVTVRAFRAWKEGNVLSSFAGRIALIRGRLKEKGRIAREAIRTAFFLASCTNWIASITFIVVSISELAVRTG